MIVITHTNHCSNWIKAVNLKFKGKPFQCEMYQFLNVINIVQFELAHYQKDAPNQLQLNHLWLQICLCLVDVKSKTRTRLQCGRTFVISVQF
jgi:hypothetical protein